MNPSTPVEVVLAVVWRGLRLLMLIAAFIPIPLFSAEVYLKQPELKRAYAILKNASLSGESLQLGETVVLHLPDMTIRFLEGHFFPFASVNGRATGFAFVGRGEAVFEPRHELEKQQLHRFTDRDRLDAEFDYLVLRTADERMQVSRFQAEANGQAVPGGLVKFNRTLQTALLERRGFNLPSRLLVEALHSQSQYVFAAFRNIRDSAVFPPIYYYVYDPRAHENIQLYEYRPRRLGQPFYTVCSYMEGDYLSPPPESPLRITKYNGWLQIDNKGFVKADLGADVFLDGYPIRSLYFQFSNLLHLHRVKDENGDSLEFIQEKDQNGFTVFFPSDYKAPDTLRLLFSYSGELMERNEDGNWYIRDRVYWHPRLGYYRRARYKLIFKYPKRLQVVSIGRLVRDWYENGWHLSYFIHNRPAKASLFAMGDFVRDGFYGPDSVFIEIYGRRTGNQRYFRKITADVANSLFFFSKFLHPYQFENLRIVEAPRLDSQGFPGFINLSYISFKMQYHGIMEALRSHEVAHQWWGNLIGWRTYRDQWLSEGFAEYMSALYLAWAFPATNLFDEIVRAWRDDIIEGGNIGVSLGLLRFGFSKDALRNSDLQQFGAIYLGQRLGQKEPMDYFLYVYEKAAYILHMLRWYMMDDRTGSDEAFWDMLNSFIRKYRGRDPSTRDFIEHVSDYLQQDMRWFFDQWLLSNAIPTYEYAYRFDRDSSGTWLRGRIIQKQVPENFRVDLPVHLAWPDGRRWRGRIAIRQPLTAFEFGPFADQPSSVIMNAGQAILAKVKR
ncbi:MAG: M1 family aminopeptidase [candidate division KSB1 bacterium]|nr:M1 family aminopeptidase [candidate division KSB1 bacterium]